MCEELVLRSEHKRSRRTLVIEEWFRDGSWLFNGCVVVHCCCAMYQLLLFTVCAAIMHALLFTAFAVVGCMCCC